MNGWTDRYWWSRDGLRLHARDYPGDAARPAVLCIPGLTRNVRDFEGVAARLSAAGWRVVVVSLRGRGESAYAKDVMTYVPLVYVQDLDALLTSFELTRVVFVGTSLGGILTMLLGATRREVMAGALLNDIGPAIEPLGVERIRGYVGRGGSWPSWLHAARDFEAIGGESFPDWGCAEWLAAAKRGCKVAASGRIVWDYDARIAEPFRMAGGEGPGVDMWPALGAFAAVPCVSVRGELSDLFSAATQARMLAAVPSMEAVVVPRAGHAPTLDEPEAVAGLERLLGRVG